MQAPIYLDYAAATPLDERVFAVMEPYYGEKFHNPSAAYQAARDVRTDIDDARRRIAQLIGVKRDDIVFTAGATESIALAFHGVTNDGGHVVIGATEHEAVRSFSDHFDTSVVGVNEKGYIHLDELEECITDETVLVSITCADGELGTMQPVRKIGQLVESVRVSRKARGIERPIYFHTDASQAAGFMGLHMSRLGVDMLTLNAGKVYGPKQVGLLALMPHVRLSPLFVGGGQERGLRGGTENVPGIIGFAKALELVIAKQDSESKRLRDLRDSLRSQLEKSVPDLIINGHAKKQLPSHLHISLPGLDAERAVFALDALGVLVATGAACAANKGTRSRTLVAVGMPDELADSSLRISLGRQTTNGQVDRAAQLISEALLQERGR